MNLDEQARKIQKIIAKAWMDGGFKQRLLSAPSKTLKEEGLEIRPGDEVRVVEDTDKVHHLVLPQKPSKEELSEDQLASVAAGTIIKPTYNPTWYCKAPCN
jgi:hypothetical protein